MPRTLVTGATGFIGSQVTRRLVQRGDEVAVTVRPGAGIERLHDLDVRQIRADILDRRSMRRALRGADRVFHVAGTTDLRASRAGLFSIAVQGTSLTVAAVDGAAFAVALIPHTLEATTLGALEPEDLVNLETDVLAKYVEKLLPR